MKIDHAATDVNEPSLLLLLATMSKPLAPSTVDGGFILTTPALKNPATSDSVFQRILQCR